MTDFAIPSEPICTENLFRRYYPAVYRLALTILEDPCEAEDAAQEVFLRASQALESFRQEASPKTWLFTITANLCRDQLRKRRTRRLLDQTLQSIHGLFSHQPGPEQTLLESEQQDQLQKALRTLDEKHRLPLVLFYLENMPAVEIARVLEISEGTVHSRLHYARRQLLGQLKGGLQTWDNLQAQAGDREVGHESIA